IPVDVVDPFAHGEDALAVLARDIPRAVDRAEAHERPVLNGRDPWPPRHAARVVEVVEVSTRARRCRVNGVEVRHTPRRSVQRSVPKRADVPFTDYLYVSPGVVDEDEPLLSVRPMRSADDHASHCAATCSAIA